MSSYSPSSASKIVFLLSIATAATVATPQTASKPAATPTHPSKTQASAAPAAKVSTSQASLVRYLCYTTDQTQPVVYFSDGFNLANPGGDADQFLQYMHVKTDFEKYVLGKYGYKSGGEDFADCVHIAFASTGATAATNTVTAKKQSLTTAAVTAKKRTVDSGWKYSATASQGGATSASASQSSKPGSATGSGDAAAQIIAMDRKISGADDPNLAWKIVSKKDPLTDEVTTQPSAIKLYLDDKMYVTVTATCSSSGVAFYFLASPGSNSDAKPAYSFYAPDSNNSDLVADVRMRADNGNVHVAQGYPNEENHTQYSNWMGLLFYQPRLVAQVTQDKEDSANTGVMALDALMAPMVKTAARSSAQTMADNSAGPLTQLETAHSIRIELPVSGAATEPVLDLNPQDSVLHPFVEQCAAKFGGTAAGSSSPAAKAGTAPRR
jgi:hypothetical protein